MGVAGDQLLRLGFRFRAHTNFWNKGELTRRNSGTWRLTWRNGERHGHRRGEGNAEVRV